MCVLEPKITPSLQVFICPVKPLVKLRSVRSTSPGLRASQTPLQFSTMDSIDALKRALLKQNPESSKFTAHHLTLARLGLVHRAYSAVIPILDNDIYNFDSEMLGYRDHLMYYLYGGMIYMAVKDWDRALLFLEVVLNSPTTNTASMIQIEAYKKWVLVGLLHKGKVSVPFFYDSLDSNNSQKLRLPHTTNSRKTVTRKRRWIEHLAAGLQCWPYAASHRCPPSLRHKIFI
jgi:hypothetical protein